MTTIAGQEKPVTHHGVECYRGTSPSSFHIQIPLDSYFLYFDSLSQGYCYKAELGKRKGEPAVQLKVKQAERPDNGTD